MNDNPKELFETQCANSSEPFALQNLGNSMEPEFEDGCIIIIDPSFKLHNKAFVVIEYEDELYFRQYLEQDNKKYIKPLNPIYPTIEIKKEFVIKGIIVQKKQRKQKAKHYYDNNLEFLA